MRQRLGASSCCFLPVGQSSHLAECQHCTSGPCIVRSPKDFAYRATRKWPGQYGESTAERDGGIETFVTSENSVPLASADVMDRGTTSNTNDAIYTVDIEPPMAELSVRSLAGWKSPERDFIARSYLNPPMVARRSLRWHVRVTEPSLHL